MAQRKIVVFTGSRAEYGLLHPVIRSLSSEGSFTVSLIVSGSHLADGFGMTEKEIDTSTVAEVKKIYLSPGPGGGPTDIPGTISQIVQGAAELLREMRPDIVMAAADRYETFAFAVAAFYCAIPIAHLFGGDVSQGGHYDDSARHAITKLAHLHFVTNEDSYRRVLALGEEPWRVHTVGSPAVDTLMGQEYASQDEIAAALDLDLSKPVVLFTQHPVTTESDRAYDQVKESLEALRELNIQTVITYPGDDTGSEQIVRALEEYSRTPNFRIRKSLGWRQYLGLLRIVSAVVGNSSSGILETPIVRVPSVNIGNRQAGRLRAENVIDVPHDREAIKKAIRTALEDKDFIKQVERCTNPYGSGGASQKIAKVLKTIPVDRRLLQKKMTV